MPDLAAFAQTFGILGRNLRGLLRCRGICRRKL